MSIERYDGVPTVVFQALDSGQTRDGEDAVVPCVGFFAGSTC
ncbi:MAG: hypothetical protein NZM28_05700 [Fimbriimonadales bacterium]|nr:hypothetical protein [Fimbriimonadales bacterium]